MKLEPREMLDATAIVASLTEEMTATRTEIATMLTADLADQIVQLQQQIAQIESDRPMTTLVPSMTVTARRSATNQLRVSFADMPEGIKVEFGNQTLNLPVGSGTVSIPLGSFSHSDRRVYTVKLLKEDGTVIDDHVGSFGVAYKEHTYGSYGYDPSHSEPSITALTHEVGAPLTEEQQNELTTLRSQLDLLLAEQTRRDTVRETAADFLDYDIDESPVVPIIHVDAGFDRATQIRYRIAEIESSHPRETVTPTMTSTARRAHPGSLQISYSNMPAGHVAEFNGLQFAIPEGSGSFDIPLSSFSHGDRRVYTVRLLQGDGAVIDDHVGSFGVQSGQHTYTTYNSDPSHSETLTALAYERILPLTETAQTELAGLRAELAVLEGTVTEDTATGFATKEEAQAILDAEIEATQAQMAAIRRGINVSNNGLQHILAQSLLERSRYLITLDQSEALVRQYYPQFFPADLQAATDARWAADPNISRGVHEQWFIDHQLDTLRETWKRVRGYGETIGGALSTAMRIITLRESPDAQHRQDAENVWRIFQNNWRSVGNPLGGLGIQTPSIEAIMQEATCLRESEAAMLVRLGKDEDTLREYEDYMRGIGLSQNARGEWFVTGSGDEKKIIADASLQDIIGGELEVGGQEQAVITNKLEIARQEIKQLGAAEALTLLRSMHQSEGMLTYEIGGRSVRADTVAGDVFLGLWAGLRPLRGHDDPAFFRTCVAVEAAFGIPALRVLNLANVTTFQRFRDGLFAMFERYGYNVSDLPEGRELPTSIEYRDSAIRIHFNTITAKEIDHIWVNLWHPDLPEKQRNVKTNIGAWQSGKMYVDVPYSQLRGSIGVSLKTIVWWEGEGDEETAFDVRGINWSKIPQVTTDNAGVVPGEYSTNVDPEKNAKEKAILAYLANKSVFPLRDPSPEQWYWNLASWYHDGQGYNAADINLPGAADHGKLVYAPAKGTIVDRAAGTDGVHTVTLEHEMEINGQLVKWYTQYLHMENTGKRDANGNITPFAVGNIVEKDEIIGAVSDIGSPGSYHLHFEVSLEGRYGQSIDLRKLLMNGLGMRVFAEDAGMDGLQMQYGDNKRFEVEWSEEVGSFVTKEASGHPYLVLDRRAQLQNSDASHSNQYWLAWEEGLSIGQMKRVVWDRATGNWYQWDIDTNDLALDENGNRLKWTITDQGYDFVPAL